MKTGKNWQNISTLKEIGVDISGLCYTRNLNKHQQNNQEPSSIECDEIGITALDISEPLEVREYCGEIQYCDYCPVDNAENMSGFVGTQNGIFAFSNEGEHGGSISNEKYSISANPCEVVEFGDWTIVISSLAHMSTQKSAVYCLQPHKYSILYQTPEILDRNAPEQFSYCTYTEKDDKLYVWLSGFENVLRYNSLLLTIDKTLQVTKQYFTCSVDANSIVLQDDCIYLGCDKMVVKIDTVLGTIRYFTKKTEEDILDLIFPN